jgi:hypothetical protein
VEPYRGGLRCFGSAGRIAAASPSGLDGHFENEKKERKEIRLKLNQKESFARVY